MKPTLKQILASVPIDQWQMQARISLAWYDGPEEGICVLSHPACIFYFRLIGDWYNPDGMDDRLFYLFEMPELTPTQFADFVRYGSQPHSQNSNEFNDAMEQNALAIRKVCTDPKVIVRTEDMRRFTAVWSVTSVVWPEEEE